jgi:2'-5' RNA ligase
MVQSIELLLDDGTDAAVRADWTALADAGLPSLASHAGASNRPHVTVAVTQDDGFAAAEAALRLVFEGWALDADGMAATIGAPVLFGGRKQRWVLARQVVPSRPLLTLHAAVHRALERNAPEATVLEQTAPDRWTPHVTLAGRMPADRLADALGSLPLDPVPARFVAARLWDSVEKRVTPLS